MKIDFLRYSIIVSGLVFMLSFIPTEMLGIELRNRELILFFDGPLQFGLLSLCVLLALINFSIKRNKFAILASSLGLIILCGLTYLFSQIDFGPQVKEDRIIYQNSNNPIHKLVFQYYESGITGNPNWQVVTTEQIGSQIRKINRLNREIFRDKVNIGDGSIDVETLPKELRLNEDRFIIEKVVMFHNDSTINYIKN